MQYTTKLVLEKYYYAKEATTTIVFCEQMSLVQTNLYSFIVNRDHGETETMYRAVIQQVRASVDAHPSYIYDLPNLVRTVREKVHRSELELIAIPPVTSASVRGVPNTTTRVKAKTGGPMVQAGVPMVQTALA